MLRKYLITFSLIFMMGVVHANPIQYKIQALSSLIYFFNEAANSIEILFEDLERENLWEAALFNEQEDVISTHLAKDLLVQAKEDYGQGCHEKAISHLRLASLYLTANWLTLNGEDTVERLEERLLCCDDEPEQTEIQEVLYRLGKVQKAKEPSLHKRSWKDLKTYPPLDSHELKRISEFVMSSKHPIKAILDSLFKDTRVTYDKDSIINAGFVIIASQPRSYIKVISHSLIPNYLAKVYLDTDTRLKKHTAGWLWLLRRCEGAEKIRYAIKKNKFEFFVVPNKWIYILPLSPKPHSPSDVEIDPKPIILIVEDMHLVPKAENVNAWKTEITKAHLKELYVIISSGRGSSYRPDNIHRTVNGKFAFIDTEYPESGPDYKSIRSYLNKEMCNYWDLLIRRGGPK